MGNSKVSKWEYQVAEKTYLQWRNAITIILILMLEIGHEVDISR